jgi:hypothetical protein
MSGGIHSTIGLLLLLAPSALASDNASEIDCHAGGQFDPAFCRYPLLDPQVSHRFDTPDELTSLAWGANALTGEPLLAAGDADGDVHVWETGFFYSHPSTWTSRLVDNVGYDNWIHQLAWSPDGRKIAVSSGANRVAGSQEFGQLTLVETATWSLMTPQRLPVGCNAAAPTPHNHHWHAICSDGATCPRTLGCVSGYSDDDALELEIVGQPGVLLKQGGGVSRAVGTLRGPNSAAAHTAACVAHDRGLLVPHPAAAHTAACVAHATETEACLRSPLAGDVVAGQSKDRNGLRPRRRHPRLDALPHQRDDRRARGACRS